MVYNDQLSISGNLQVFYPDQCSLFQVKGTNIIPQPSTLEISFKSVYKNSKMFNSSGRFIVVNPKPSPVSFRCLNGKFIEQNASMLGSDFEYFYSDSFLFVFSLSNQQLKYKISTDLQNFFWSSESQIQTREVLIRVDKMKDYVFVKTNRTSSEFSFVASANLEKVQIRTNSPDFLVMCGQQQVQASVSADETKKEYLTDVDICQDLKLITMNQVIQVHPISATMSQSNIVCSVVSLVLSLVCLALMILFCVKIVQNRENQEFKQLVAQGLVKRD